MSDQYEPVRCWAEYDEWSVFYEDRDHIQGAQWWPKGANGEASSIFHGVTGGLVDALTRVTEWYAPKSGPLRSLRVLLRSGHEVEIFPHPQAQPYWTDRTKPRENGVYWCANVFGEDPGMGITRPWLWSAATFESATDAEAVSRALSEARRWLEEQEVAG